MASLYFDHLLKRSPCEVPFQVLGIVNSGYNTAKKNHSLQHMKRNHFPSPTGRNQEKIQTQGCVRSVGLGTK